MEVCRSLTETSTLATPSTPLGCLRHSPSGTRQARGVTLDVKNKNVIITELPPGVASNTVQDRIRALVESGELAGVEDDARGVAVGDENARHARVGADGGAGLGIVGVARADAGAGIGLNPNLVALAHGFAHRKGCHADAILVILDFLRNANEHGALPDEGRTVSELLSKKFPN